MTPEEFKKICKEFDASPEDASWDEGHPIFQLAQDNDKLCERLRAGRDYLMSVEPDQITISDCFEAFGFGSDGS